MSTDSQTQPVCVYVYTPSAYQINLVSSQRSFQRNQLKPADVLLQAAAGKNRKSGDTTAMKLISDKAQQR